MPKNNKQTEKRKKGVRSRSILIAAGILIIAAAFIVNSFWTGPKRTAERATERVTTGEQPLRYDADAVILSPDSTERVRFKVEIAETERSRMQGLMYRSILPTSQGMFFIFEKEEPRSFWMKNTYIPLDIIYINNNMKIVKIQSYTQPLTTSSVPSERPARFVLEINAGLSDKYGIKEGDVLLLERKER